MSSKWMLLLTGWAIKIKRLLK